MEPGGRVHDCCGRTHAKQYAMQQGPSKLVHINGTELPQTHSEISRYSRNILNLGYVTWSQEFLCLMSSSLPVFSPPQLLFLKACGARLQVVPDLGGRWMMAVDTMTSVASAAETMGHQVRLQVISYLDASCLVKAAEMNVSVHKTNSTWPSFKDICPYS